MPGHPVLIHMADLADLGTMTSRHATKLLFICSRNRIRSLTAEKLMNGVPGYRAASAGTQPVARVVVTHGLIRWADIIFCMEKAHPKDRGTLS